MRLVVGRLLNLELASLDELLRRQQLQVLRRDSLVVLLVEVADESGVDYLLLALDLHADELDERTPDFVHVAELFPHQRGKVLSQFYWRLLRIPIRGKNVIVLLLSKDLGDIELGEV